jgi:hypothetical protein
MARIDFTGLTNFIPEAVNDMKDLIKQELFTSSDLRDKVTVVNGIEYSKRVGYLSRLGDVGVRSTAAACALTTVDARVTTNEKTWTPRPFDTRLRLCAEDVINTLGITGLKHGVNQTDLTDTEYLNLFLDMLKVSLTEGYNRMTWLGDMNAARFIDSPAGGYSNVVDGAAFNLNFVNMQFGFFVRMFQAIAAVPANYVDISATNAPGTYAGQIAAMTPAIARATAENLTTNLPLDFDYDGVYFGCTRYFFNALRSNFQGFALESTKTNLENGLEGININGVAFVPIREIDWLINRYHNSGTAWWNPHRVWAMRKDNLLLGVPDVSVWDDFEMFYNKHDRHFYIDIKDKFDTMLLQDNQMALAL